MKRGILFVVTMCGLYVTIVQSQIVDTDTEQSVLVGSGTQGYAAFKVPDGGAILTLTLFTSGDTYITETGTVTPDTSDTAQWYRAERTQPCPGSNPVIYHRHIYKTALVLSSREWVRIRGQTGLCSPPPPPTPTGEGVASTPLPQPPILPFNVDVPAVDIDIEGVSEEQEESVGGFICVGTTCMKKVTINPVQPTSRHSGTVTLSGTGVSPAAGAKVKLWADAARTTAITLPKTYTTPSGLPPGIWVEGIAGSDSPRDIELKVSYTTPDGKIAEDKVRLTVVPSEFEIQVTGFIPEDHVFGLGSLFSGDGAIPVPPSLAGFTRARTSFRLRQRVTVIPSQALSASGLKPGTVMSVVGESVEYDAATSLAGTPPLLTAAAKADTVPGQPLKWNWDTATPSHNAQTITRINANQVKAYFRMAAADPLLGGSPDMDWELEVFIDVSNPLAPTYHAVGDHDGYPAYDVYINEKRVHQYDPRATGEGILSLFAPMDKHFDTTGTLP